MKSLGGMGWGEEVTKEVSVGMGTGGGHHLFYYMILKLAALSSPPITAWRPLRAITEILSLPLFPVPMVTKTFCTAPPHHIPLNRNFLHLLLESNPLFHSANHIPHILLVAYCLSYIRLPKSTQSIYLQWIWQVQCLLKQWISFNIQHSLSPKAEFYTDLQLRKPKNKNSKNIFIRNMVLT
jgi:hypothetical protein